MAKIEERLSTLGLVQPPEFKPAVGVVLPYQFVRVVGRRAFISGHGPQARTIFELTAGNGRGSEQVRNVWVRLPDQRAWLILASRSGASGAPRSSRG